MSAPAKTGWRSKFGAFLKGLSAPVLGYVAMQLPDIIHGVVASGTKTGLAAGIGLAILGDAINKWGAAGKQEKIVAAVEENTRAVEGASELP